MTDLQNGRENTVRVQTGGIARHARVVVMLWTIGLLAAGCRGTAPDEIPTLVPSVDALATSVMLTENAPPPGYRDAITFERVDNNLRELEGWRYVVILEFEGAFTQTNRETSARAEATVWYNQIGSARRVIVESSGELLQRPEGETFEAVRLGPDAFLLRGGNCLSNAEEDAFTASGIAAGDLVGGARNALPTGERERINGVETWRYDFGVEDMLLPAVRFAEDTRINEFSAEMWVSPAHDAVIRYWVTLNMQNVRLLNNDLPLNGELRLRYDLHDIGVIPNISVPFGC